jgi:hypothetical protein
MKVRQEDANVVNGSDNNICTKYVQGKHATRGFSVTPGALCSDGIVYGYAFAFALCSISFLIGYIIINLSRFKVMTQAESPETAFSIMMRLFPARKFFV